MHCLPGCLGSCRQCQASALQDRTDGCWLTWVCQVVHRSCHNQAEHLQLREVCSIPRPQHKYGALQHITRYEKSQPVIAEFATPSCSRVTCCTFPVDSSHRKQSCRCGPAINRLLSRGSLCCPGGCGTCRLNALLQATSEAEALLCTVSCKTAPFSTRACLQIERERMSTACVASHKFRHRAGHRRLASSTLGGGRHCCPVTAAGCWCTSLLEGCRAAYAQLPLQVPTAGAIGQGSRKQWLHDARCAGTCEVCCQSTKWVWCSLDASMQVPQDA